MIQTMVIDTNAITSIIARMEDLADKLPDEEQTYLRECIKHLTFELTPEDWSEELDEIF